MRAWIKLAFLAGLTSCSCGDGGSSPVDTGVPRPDAPASPPRLAAAPSLRFGAEPARVVSLALAPDGRTLAATGWEGRVVLFDVSTAAGRAVHSLGAGDLFEPRSAAWNGERLAVGTFSSLLLFARDGSLAATTDGRSREVRALGEGFVRERRGVVERVDATGAVVASTELAGIESLVVADGTPYALVSGADYELVELDPSTLAPGRRGPFEGSRAAGRGPVVGLLLDRAVLHRGLERVGPLATAGLGWDFRTFDAVGALAVGLGNDRGVSLFDVPTRAHLDSADVPTAEAILLDADRRVFAGSPEGVEVFDIVRTPR